LYAQVLSQIFSPDVNQKADSSTGKFHASSE
jgi:hypothetical protein